MNETRDCELEIEVSTRERLRLATDLHDGPIQRLTAVALKLDLMHGDHEPSLIAPDRRQRMCADIDHSIDNIRGVIGALDGRQELCASDH